MKKIIVSTILLISLTVGLVGTLSGCSESRKMAELAGCYALVSGEYYEGDELVRTYSADTGSDSPLVIKLRSSGDMLIRFGGRADGGRASLEDGLLTLTSGLGAFAGLGQARSCLIAFGEEIRCTVNLEVDGEAARLNALLEPVEEYDDDFFTDDPDPLYIGVRGLADSYGVGKFSSFGVEVGFIVWGNELWLPLAQISYEVKEYATEGRVIGEYEDCYFVFTFPLSRDEAE